MDPRIALGVVALVAAPFFIGVDLACTILLSVAAASPLIALCLWLRRKIPQWGRARARLERGRQQALFLLHHEPRVMDDLRSEQLCCYYTTRYNTEAPLFVSPDYAPLHRQCRLGLGIDMPTKLALRLLARFCAERVWLLRHSETHRVMHDGAFKHVARAMFGAMYPHCELIEPERDEGDDDEA